MKLRLLLRLLPHRLQLQHPRQKRQRLQPAHLNPAALRLNHPRPYNPQQPLTR